MQNRSGEKKRKKREEVSEGSMKGEEREERKEKKENPSLRVYKTNTGLQWNHQSNLYC